MKVVVVGAGMVGHRLVEELAGADLEVHLVGEEEYEPYNRILLTDVLAGRTELTALTMPLPDESVCFHRGIAATRIDRERAVVELADGSTLGYDRLVLATGARAFVPPIEGLAARLRHVHVLRTLDDCRDVTARAMNARHAVVLGGGVLGLEAACGLRRRGVPVTVVDLDETLMAAQLDAGAGTALAGALGALGVDVRTGTSVAEVISADEELAAVRLADGSVLAADLLLLSCGIRPNTTLAAEAGLAVDRGIVVDALLATDDPHVFALGDCAQPPEGGTGLLGPGWRQAERLAAVLRGSPPCELPVAPGPVRLKAAGIDLVTSGMRGSAAVAGDRVVTVTDPAGGRHAELVVRDERLVGLTCLGMPEAAAAAGLVLDRGTPTPVDPLDLLLPQRTAEEASPLHMPGSTTVCRCNTVTKQQVVAAWERGSDTVEKVAAATRATTGCGGCTDVVCGLVEWLEASDPRSPASPAAAGRPAHPVAQP